MKLVRVVKGDGSASFNKCLRWANEIYSGSLSIKALPGYISKYASSLDDIHEADEIADILERSKKSLERTLQDISKAIRDLGM